MKNYIASFSGGKDSLAMVLRILELKLPLTHVLMYDTGMEFNAIYNVIEKIRPLIEDYGAQLVILRPETDFLFDMLLKPVCAGTCEEHYGYEWCGGCVRWRTSQKIQTINQYIRSLDGTYEQYIGIAYDEPERIDYTGGKRYPLVEWKWTEKDCLLYCYNHGWHWNEPTKAVDCGYIDLYSVLKRVSCWCCKNKNIRELRNIYHYLPYYWNLLKALQSRIKHPYKSNASIFDLEKRFISEDSQYSLFDYFGMEEMKPTFLYDYCCKR